MYMTCYGSLSYYKESRFIQITAGHLCDQFHSDKSANLFYHRICLVSIAM